MPNYYVFFTTQYTDVCFRHCRFGASTVNALANINMGDVAFIFDGLQWKIYGPLRILSNGQYYDDLPIYGKNRKGTVRYPYRVSFDVDRARELSLNTLFADEEPYCSESYCLNRTLLSTLIANKQVSATPLTVTEGKYLETELLCRGKEMKVKRCSEIDESISRSIYFRCTRSEAWFELLVLRGLHTIKWLRHGGIFNQFILGIQRQIDILIVYKSTIVLVELKRKENGRNPYEQLMEYKDYVMSDYRLQEFRPTEVALVAMLEYGNRYLKDWYHYPDIQTLEITMLKNCELYINMRSMMQ